MRQTMTFKKVSNTLISLIIYLIIDILFTTSSSSSTYSPEVKEISIAVYRFKSFVYPKRYSVIKNLRVSS